MLKTIGKLLGSFVIPPANYMPSSQKQSTSPATTNIENIELQVQDMTGYWRTFHVTLNESQRIISGMQQLSSQFPGQRIRAVNSNGRIIDIL